MLAEFSSITIPTCSKILSQQKSIAENSGVDVIDLSSLVTDSASLAATAFNNPRLLGASEVIARKEAYDFSQAHSRLSDVFNRDRASYYEQSIEEITTAEKFVQHQEAIFLKYIEHSTV
jgi:hypothetical protein